MRGFQVCPGDLIMSCSGTMGKVVIIPEDAHPGIINQALLKLTPTKKILGIFLKFCMESSNFQQSIASAIYGSAIKNVGSVAILKSLRLPLPPLEVQKEIVAEIEGYQKVIDGARAVVNNYRPHIPINPDWPMVELGEVCNVKGGKRLPKGERFSNIPTRHPYIRVTDFRDQTVDKSNLKFITDEVFKEISKYTIASEDVYISIAGTIGLMGTVPDELNGANLTENAAKLVFNPDRLDKYFLSIVGNGELVQEQIQTLTHAVGVPKLALERIRILKISLPPLTTQQAIVAEIRAEQSLIAVNNELITRFEKKIQTTLARIWGDDELVSVND
jgi:restriction endonuclease S subunit